MPITLSSTEAQSIQAYESHFDHTALFEFSKVINSSLDPAFINSHILLTIMGKILSPRGMVLLAQRDAKRQFAVEMVKGFSADLVGQSISIARVPRSIVDLASMDTVRHPWAQKLRDLGVAVLLPLYIADKPIGLLGFADRLATRPLEAREKTYLRSLANISATAIEKSRTITELVQVNRRLDRKIQELNTLFDLGKEFSGMLDPDKLVRLLVFSLLGQVGVSRYLICLRDGPDMRVAASRMDGPAPQGELLTTLANLKAAVPVADLIVRQKTDPRTVLAACGIAVVVPMQLQGESKGLVLLGERLNKEPFSEEDLEFLSSLVNLATISLENARLFSEAIEKQKLEDELMIARDIQKGLLPSVLPDIPGMEVAASNISSKQVGGDYYDVVPLREGAYIIAIGDVSGKGPPAALLMANLQATIRALVPLELGLGELTGRVNDLMCQNTGGNKFVTFFWGAVDYQARTLRYVNAGHNYPYLFHADGTVDRLDKGGMILGVMPVSQPYEEDEVPLRGGDLLVLFTDGVSEAMSKSSEEFGEERLERTLREHGALGAQAIISAVHSHIQDFTRGAPQSDDITMMVLKVA